MVVIAGVVMCVAVLVVEGTPHMYSHLQVLRIYFGAFCVSSWPPPVRIITVPTVYSKCVFRFLTKFAYSKYLEVTLNTQRYG